MTDEVLIIVRHDKDIQNGNSKKAIELVETKVLPNFNFQHMTALAMGRDWNKATPEQQIDNGRLVAQRIQNTYVGTIIRGLKASGTVSVWALLERFPIAWGRLMEGGSSAVYRLGPKEARVECHGVPFADIAYFRAGWEGMFESTIELVTRKVYTRQLPGLQTPTVIAYRVSWV